MTPRVLGLDLSLTAAAVASSAGWVEIRGAAGKRGDDYATRLTRVHTQVAAIVDLVTLDTALAVIEGPAYRMADPSAFDRAYLWWSIFRYCHDRGIPVAVVTPSQRALYAAGKGNASKGAVIDAVARRWPGYLTRGDDNAADAVALMAMGLDHLGQPLTPMPAAHRAALVKVAWPEVRLPIDGCCPACREGGVEQTHPDYPGARLGDGNHRVYVPHVPGPVYASLLKDGQAADA